MAPVVHRSPVVLAIAALLGVGTWALVRYVPVPEGAGVGQRAPDYRVVRARDGASIGIRSANAGHVTLVNIWATWCLPCRAEMPSIERAYEAYRDRGFRVAAASIDSGSAATVLAYARQAGLSFDILRDPGGAIQDAYQTVGVPESFLLDRHGRITYVALGAETWDSPENRARIEHLLDGSD